MDTVAQVQDTIKKRSRKILELNRISTAQLMKMQVTASAACEKDQNVLNSVSNWIVGVAYHIKTSSPSSQYEKPFPKMRAVERREMEGKGE